MCQGFLLWLIKLLEVCVVVFLHNVLFTKLRVQKTESPGMETNITTHNYYGVGTIKILVLDY